jgi:hypothetical protein
MPYLNGSNFTEIKSFGKETYGSISTRKKLNSVAEIFHNWDAHAIHSQDRLRLGKTYDRKAQVSPIVHDSLKPRSFGSSIAGYESRKDLPTYNNNPIGSKTPISNPEGKTTSHLLDKTQINPQLPILNGPKVNTASPYKGSFLGAYKQRGAIKQ